MPLPIFPTLTDAVAGTKVRSAQYNDLIDALLALKFWGATGDIPYGYDADQLEVLAKPTSLMTLLMDATGVPYWGQAPFAFKHHTDATGHTYNSSTERVMPNSTNTLNVLVTSTVFVVARIFANNVSGNCWTWFTPRISGTNGALYGKQNYGAGIGISTVAFASKPNVPAGSITILLREKEGYGSGLTYTVEHLEWFALAIPEP